MSISIFHALIFGFVAMLLWNIVSAFRRKKEASEETQIVGHTKPESKEKTPAKPMAVPMETMTIAPAFAEAPDWSEYDQPTFLRNKRSEEAEAKEAEAKEAEAKEAAPAAKTKANEEAKPAPCKPASKKATPQQQMQAFKQHAKSRRNTKPSFEEI